MNEEMSWQTEMQSGKPEYDLNSLETMYLSADSCDKELFAEQRSNLLLIAGEHYNRLRSNFFKRLRDSRSINNESKIRLTKNHLGKIHESYVNHIISTAPGVGFEPANSSELSDQKAAELNHSVWEFARSEYKLDDKIYGWADDFTGIGEVFTKIFYDPNEGEQIGVNPDGSPRFKGKFVFEEVFGFNLLRDPAAKSMEESPWIGIRKMVPTKKLKQMYPESAEKIQVTSDGTYLIFNEGRGGYEKSKDSCLVKEFYWKPCAAYPKGWFCIWVKETLLVEGELPAGVFPIIGKGFKRKQTSPRSTSVIKTLRPFQAEINRAASKIAEHQITLGDDKLLIQHGTKVSQGASLPGVRAVNYTGMKPEVLSGRDGSQYLNYMNAQISEMYVVANIDEKEDVSGQLDPHVLLFRAASKKKQFQIYIKRFEGFLIEVAEVYLKLARYHLPDDMVIQMVGRKEMVNIAEFRGTSPLCYKIKVEAQSDDIETKLGKQLTITHALQYVGSKLDKEDIGKLMKAMPYSNFDESFGDLLIDYEAATNDILALDRGETPPLSPFDQHPYMIKRLTQRMRQADFFRMPPNIQQNYAMKLKAHEMAEAQRLKAIQQAESGFIPIGGHLVACDLYVATDPKDPSKTRRARLPYMALQWLIDKLDSQGASMEELQTMNEGNLADMAQMMGPQQGGNPSPAMSSANAQGVSNGNQSNLGTTTDQRI
jgi:hypothetical protein